MCRILRRSWRTCSSDWNGTRTFAPSFWTWRRENRWLSAGISTVPSRKSIWPILSGTWRMPVSRRKNGRVWRRRSRTRIWWTFSVTSIPMRPVAIHSGVPEPIPDRKISAGGWIISSWLGRSWTRSAECAILCKFPLLFLPFFSHFNKSVKLFIHYLLHSILFSLKKFTFSKFAPSDSPWERPCFRSGTVSTEGLCLLVFLLHRDVTGSDHCPIMLYMDDGA